MNATERDVALAVNKLRLMKPGKPTSLFGSTVTRTNISGNFQIAGIEGIHAISSAARKIIALNHKALGSVR